MHYTRPFGKAEPCRNPLVSIGILVHHLNRRGGRARDRSDVLAEQFPAGAGYDGLGYQQASFARLGGAG